MLQHLPEQGPPLFTDFVLALVPAALPHADIEARRAHEHSPAGEVTVPSDSTMRSSESSGNLSPGELAVNMKTRKKNVKTTVRCITGVGGVRDIH